MEQDASVRSIPELRQFGTTLNQASVALSTLFQQLNGQMHHVCDSWNDNKARSFANEFDQSKAQIDKIAQDMQQFSTYIIRSCEILEQYQSLHR